AVGTGRRGHPAPRDSVLSGRVRGGALSAGDPAADGEGLRRGRDVERFLRVHARDHGECGRQHGRAGRAVRAGPESLPRRTARWRVRNRFRQRPADYGLPQHLAVTVDVGATHASSYSFGSFVVLIVPLACSNLYWFRSMRGSVGTFSSTVSTSPGCSGFR